MKNPLIIALAAITLASCAGPGIGSGGLSSQPTVQGIWLRSDGQSGKDNPALAQQFAVDKAACTRFGDVDRTCMAQRGYLLVPESEAEARAVQLRAQSRSY